MNNGKAVNKNLGRAVTVAGNSIRIKMTAEYAMAGSGSRCRFHTIQTNRSVQTNDAAVTRSVGEDNGCVKASRVRRIAVNPKLAPSFQASPWTRNQTPDSSA